MERKKLDNKTIVMTGLMMALVVVATSFFKVPNPFTQGHLNLGDAVVLLGVLLLGKKYGALAGGVGSALGDLLGGYAMWVPWTLVIKYLMAFVAGAIIEKDTKPGITALKILGMAAGGAVMIVGYYIAGYFLYGNWLTAVPAVPLNALQYLTGTVLAFLVSEALRRSQAFADLKNT